MVAAPWWSWWRNSMSLARQSVLCLWRRELQERLRSLVGGAISRMTREKASKDHIAGLERQLQLLKVPSQPFPLR